MYVVFSVLFKMEYNMVVYISALFLVSTFNICVLCAKAPLRKLNDGHEMPTLALGTWLGYDRNGPKKLKDNEFKSAVEWAIDAGYRHIDTAATYGTEPQVGEAVNKKIADGVVARKDMFITTKLWNDRHAKNQVMPALRESLKRLNLQYVDLYLIHWPIGFKGEPPNTKFDSTDYLETWRGMVEASDLGLTRSIGVSNFNKQQLQRLLKNSNVKPAALQVEINLNLQQPSLLALCKKHNITVMGYTPFGSLIPSKATAMAPPPRISEPALVSIAKKYNKTVSQIVLRYLTELGVVPLPKTIMKSRVEQYIDIFDFSLTTKEKKHLRSYDKHYRTVVAPRMWKKSPYYPFEK